MAETRKKRELSFAEKLKLSFGSGGLSHLPFGIGTASKALGNSANKSSNQKASQVSQMRQDLGRTPLMIDPNTNRQADPRAKNFSKGIQRDPMQELLDSLSQSYSGTMPGYDDSEAIAALDAALGNTLQGISGLRDRTNENYRLSDDNLKSMHSAYQNDISTNGAAAYNGIADTHVNSVNQTRDNSVNALTAIEDDSRAKRAAMLQSLGIQASAAAPESTEIKDAQQSIISRANADAQFAEDTRATNQAYNTGVAQSVGSAGLQRRDALQRQLNDAMGTIDAKEMDARSAYQQQRASLASQKAGNQNNLAQFEYGMFRDEQNSTRDLLDQLLSAQEESAESPVIKGYAGLAQDLVNSGIPNDMASRAMQTHAEIVGSQEYSDLKRRGGDATSYLVRSMQAKGIPPAVAIQWVTNYNNLGNTSGYSALG